jgi:hypothetical protein
MLPFRMFILKNEGLVANPTLSSLSSLSPLCVSAFSSPSLSFDLKLETTSNPLSANADAVDAASSLSPLPATLTKNTRGWGTSVTTRSRSGQCRRESAPFHYLFTSLLRRFPLRHGTRTTVHGPRSSCRLRALFTPSAEESKVFPGFPPTSSLNFRLLALSLEGLTFFSRSTRLNSCLFTLLRTLLHRAKDYPLSFQANPNSFRKTPGVGCAQCGGAL